MPSELRPEARQNWGDKVFADLPGGPNEPALVARFLADSDFSPHTRRAFANDLRKFVRWFTAANQEPFAIGRVTTRDVADFRDHLRRQQAQAVATVNRALVTVRRFFTWLVATEKVFTNVANGVKDLRRQPLAPKGLQQDEVRRLLREVELQGDLRAAAIFSLFLYTGCRVGDLVALELGDLMIGERSGAVVFRFGKGGKQRSVPLPPPARMTLTAYLGTRPPVSTARLFVGERGPLTDRGVRALCGRYGARIGVAFHPHLLRHTMAHQFLSDAGNDLVSLAQILGHESLTTTARYTRRTEGQLATAADRLSY